MLSPIDTAYAQTAGIPATSGFPPSRNKSTNGLWDSLRADRLQWLPELGIGWYPVTAQPYDEGYFANYAALANTDIGRRLNAARLAMLSRNWPGPDGVVDVGIGAGTFCESRPGTKGFDVNPTGVEWLTSRGLFLNPYLSRIHVACFWDSLEHIHDPVPLLNNVGSLVLVSLPIFRNVAHVLDSKHYKREEHCWYFTDSGIRSFMAGHGWRCVETNDEETRIGREDIRSYAFRRATT